MPEVTQRNFGDTVHELGTDLTLLFDLLIANADSGVCCDKLRHTTKCCAGVRQKRTLFVKLNILIFRLLGFELGEVPGWGFREDDGRKVILTGFVNAFFFVHVGFFFGVAWFVWFVLLIVVSEHRVRRLFPNGCARARLRHLWFLNSALVSCKPHGTA